MRIAALVILACLLAPSVSRIACAWECGAERATAQSASCHEHDSGAADQMVRAAVTTCHEDRPLVLTRVIVSAPTSAPAVLAGVRFHNELTVPSRTFVAINTSAPPAAHAASIQLRI